LITKYGLSREAIHYGNILEPNLPLISETIYDEDMNENLDKLSFHFRSNIQKFLRNRERRKTYYKNKEKVKFYLHELVMRKNYTPSSMLSPTFLGPYRIIKLQEMGALLKNPRTGEQCSVHYENLRKLNVDELLCILPTNFDSDIVKELTFRYNKVANPELPERVKSFHDDNVFPDPVLSDDNRHLSTDTDILGHNKVKNHENKNSEKVHDSRDPKTMKNSVTTEQIVPVQDTPFGRRHRSGKIFSLQNITVEVDPQIAFGEIAFAIYNTVTTHARQMKPCLKTVFRPNPTVYASSKQTFYDGCWSFGTSISEHEIKDDDHGEKRKYSSGFKSPLPGTLTLKLNFEQNYTKIKFDKIYVHFY
jgi:hypothetical protein